MLTPDQINQIHRLHWVEKWPLRKIARHLRIGRRTIAKYLDAPAPAPAHRDRASKLDPFKPAIAVPDHRLMQIDRIVEGGERPQGRRARECDPGGGTASQGGRPAPRSRLARAAAQPFFLHLRCRREP